MRKTASPALQAWDRRPPRENVRRLHRIPVTYQKHLLYAVLENCVRQGFGRHETTRPGQVL